MCARERACVRACVCVCVCVLIHVGAMIQIYFHLLITFLNIWFKHLISSVPYGIKLFQIGH